MALTVSNIDNSMFGNKYAIMADVAFDSSYAIGGEALAANAFGLNTIERLIVEPCQGYTFEYDHTDHLLKVFAPAPPIVHEELVTCTSKVGYLKWPAAHINYIVAATANYIPIAGGVTPASGQCSVDQGFDESTGVLTKGYRTKLTFEDAVTTCYVSYATQAWKELTDNMEQAKITGAGSDTATKNYGNSGMAADPLEAADVVSLGTDIIAMQSITWSDGGTIKVPELLKDGGTPAATLEMEIDFVKSSNAEVVCLTADAIDTASDIMYFVYITKPSSGFLSERFTNADIAHSSDVIIFTANPLIYGSCGQLPMTTSDKKAYWIKGSDTLAAGEINWTHLPHFINDASSVAPSATCHSATDETVVPAWIAGDPSEIATVPLQCYDTTDLSNLSAVKVMAIGY